MGIRLFVEASSITTMTLAAPRVAIINETLARQFFPNEDPIGKRILVTNGPDAWRQIVGIVGDIKQYGVDKETTSQTYEPFAQSPFDSLNIILRTSDSGAALARRAATGCLCDRQRSTGRDIPSSGGDPRRDDCETAFRDVAPDRLLGRSRWLSPRSASTA